MANHTRKRPRSPIECPLGVLRKDVSLVVEHAAQPIHRLASVIHFENEEKLSPGVHLAYRFALITNGAADSADLVFFARHVRDLASTERHVSLAESTIVCTRRWRNMRVCGNRMNARRYQARHC